MNRTSSVSRVEVDRIAQGEPHREMDAVVVEEPLEIRVRVPAGTRPFTQTLSVTMRTPGDDAELAAGFLLTEGIIVRREDIDGIECGDNAGGPEASNVVTVSLRPGIQLDLKRLLRHFYTSSSCGVCGKTSLEAVRVRVASPPLAGSPRLDPEVVRVLPDRLRAAQGVFEQTGGLHAAGLFDAEGNLISAREDVGRHNAVDKVVGEQLLRGAVPLHGRILLVSGRASFEIVQKALMAGIPVIAAVGAPSSLAVELAREFGATLLGFVRGGSFSAYAGTGRLLLPSPARAA